MKLHDLIKKYYPRIIYNCSEEDLERAAIWLLERKHKKLQLWSLINFLGLNDGKAKTIKETARLLNCSSEKISADLRTCCRFLSREEFKYLLYETISTKRTKDQIFKDRFSYYWEKELRAHEHRIRLINQKYDWELMQEDTKLRELRIRLAAWLSPIEPNEVWYKSTRRLMPMFLGNT